MAIKSGFDPSSAGLFTDLNQLSQFKGQAKTDEQAALQGVAKEFEQLFMNMMLKSMRQAGDVLAEDSPFNSSDVKFYQGMFDEQLTLDLSRRDGIGLADIIVKQLSQKADPVSRPDTGNDDNEALTVTEQMLNRALSTGPVSQSPGVAYVAPASEEEAESAEAPSGPEQMADEGQATSASPLPERFDSPEEFIAYLAPLADKAAKALGVSPSVLLAQAALETGWGKFVTRDVANGLSSHNLFNIKADSGWQGDAVQVQTLEYRGGVPDKEMARFRAYDDYSDSFDDYVDFLRGNPRYQQALEQGSDPGRFVRELHAAGYATDPEYASKIERIFNSEWLAGLAVEPQEG